MVKLKKSKSEKTKKENRGIKQILKSPSKLLSKLKRNKKEQKKQKVLKKKKVLPRKKDEDIILFFVVLAGLLTAIVISALLLFIVPKEPLGFSSVSFDNPDDLPNLVQNGETYSFAYTVQSFENETKEYEIDARLEVYRLYDTTEGIYSCLSPYRQKIYLKWTNESNLTHIKTPDTNEIIPDLRINPDISNPITWDTYHFKFKLGRKFGKGDFLIWFESENKTLYQYTINAERGEILFGEEVIAPVVVARQNDQIQIDYNNTHIKFSYNGLEVHEFPIENATNGQFGFESRDIFIDLNQMIVHKDLPVEVPDKGNIWEYSVANNLFFNLLAESKGKATKIFPMSRNYLLSPQLNTGEEEPQLEAPALINQSDELFDEIIGNLNNKTEEDSGFIQCKNDFACNYLSTQDKEYYVAGENLTSLVTGIPATKYGSRFWLQAREFNDTLIPWDSYKFDASYDSLYFTDSIFFLWGEEFGLLISKGSYATLIADKGGVSIQQYKFTGQQEFSVSGENRDNFTVFVDKNTLNITVGDKNTYVDLNTINSSLLNSSFRMFHLNTFSSVREVRIKNSRDECKFEEFYNFCEIIYRFDRRAPSGNTPDPNQYGHIYDEETSIINPLPIPSYNESDKPLPETPLIDEIGIPTKTIAFNGPISIIKNKTNVTFGVQSLYLDGDGILDISFHDLQGVPLVTMQGDFFNETINFRYLKNNTQENISINRILQNEEWNSWQIILYEDNVTFKHNNTLIHTILNYTLDSGFFSISKIRSHFELQNVYTKDNKLNTARRLPLLEDPCKLRLVHSEKLSFSNFTLSPFTNQTFEEDFSISTFFDYGKISINLNGSSNVNKSLNNGLLGIQFWLVRS